MFFDGKHVGKTLGWVEFVCETIPDWYACILGEFLDGFMGETAEFDAVKHAAKYECGITD